MSEAPLATPRSGHPRDPRSGSRGSGGFWRRLWASGLDGIFLSTGVDLVMGLITDWIDVPRGPFGTRFAVKLIVGWLYYAGCEASPIQATLGKLAFGMRVTDEEGRRVSFGRATVRHWAKLLSGVGTLGFGFLAIAFDRRKQGLHDRIAHCLVVRAR